MDNTTAHEALADERELLQERKARYAELDARLTMAINMGATDREVNRLSDLLDRQHDRIQQSREAIRQLKPLAR